MGVPRDAMDEAKALALQKLDHWEQMALEQYHARHVLVSHGKVARRVVNGEPEVLEDCLPKLRAIDLLLKIERERRTIMGYTAEPFVGKQDARGPSREGGGRYATTQACFSLRLGACRRRHGSSSGDAGGKGRRRN
jgi:hypothetical protein